MNIPYIEKGGWVEDKERCDRDRDEVREGGGERGEKYKDGGREKIVSERVR